MSNQPETNFRKRFEKTFDTYFPRAWRTKIQAGSIRGIPDLIVCEEGVFGAFELKMEQGNEGPQFPLQQRTMEWIQRSGGYASVVYPDTVGDILEEFKGHVRSIVGKHYR